MEYMSDGCLQLYVFGNGFKFRGLFIEDRSGICRCLLILWVMCCIADIDPTRVAHWSSSDYVTLINQWPIINEPLWLKPCGWSSFSLWWELANSALLPLAKIQTGVEVKLKNLKCGCIHTVCSWNNPLEILKSLIILDFSSFSPPAACHYHSRQTGAHSLA